MARVSVADGRLALEMGRWEELAALHRSVAVGLDEVVSIDWADRSFSTLRGIRAPGTGIPGRLMIGTTRHDGAKDLNVVRNPGPAIVVELFGGEFVRWVVSDPQARQRSQELQEELRAWRSR